MMSLRKGLSLAGAAGVALVGLIGFLRSAAASSNVAPLDVSDVTAVEYATGLSQPVDIVHTGSASDSRLFIVERDGRIKIVLAGGTVLGTPFLDIDSIVDAESYGEQGLLGLAFSPDYATDGRFYVYYVDNSGDLQLSRYSVSPDPNVANTTETKILNIPHPTNQNHNGGDLAFGPDGFLYLAPGDGGSGGDPPNNAQNLNVLLGKVLRLNVTGAATYTIPAGNPYVGVTGRDEIWALGLRNPFRFSFDRQTGDMYIGDVGQSEWEEVDYQPAGVSGLNYGWHCREGNHPYLPAGCSVADRTDPVAEYCNSGQGASCTDGGRSVIGGYVYRGAAFANMNGYYFFADNSSSRFWAMLAGSPWTVTPLAIANVPNPGSFGESPSGQLYVSSLGNGKIYCLRGDSTPISITPENPIYLPLVIAPGGC
jgi:glucose/arabinose dehydrogenase